MSGIQAYDMRKLMPALASKEEFSVAFLRDYNGDGKYIPAYVSPEMYETPLVMPDIEEASEKGLLFAYASPEIVNDFLPTIANILGHGYDIDTALEAYLEYNDI